MKSMKHWSAKREKKFHLEVQVEEGDKIRSDEAFGGVIEEAYMFDHDIRGSRSTFDEDVER